MPVLHLDDVPSDVYERLRQLAADHGRPLQAEAIDLMRHALRSVAAGRSQAELLADLRRHSFTPPAGTPDSVELLREDRGR
jgi:plasmid stability protein